MSVHAVLATSGVVVVATVDTLLVLRVLRAYRVTHRTPHLVVAAGIVASFCAVVGASLVFAAEGAPELRGGWLFSLARALAFVGAALAYGLVGLFAATAYGRSRAARPLAAAMLVGLVVVAGAALALHPKEVATPATTRWAFRGPFLALSLAGSLGGWVRARVVSRTYEAARRTGRVVDAVVLGRMRTMATGFLCMVIGQAAFVGYAPYGAFDTPLGLASTAVILLGALGFTLACVATWATPAWLRAKWEAA